VTVLLWSLAIVMVVVGVAGIVLPALPGHMLVFAGLLLAAWADGFTRVGPATLVILGVLAGLSYLVDFVAGALGVRRVGASGRAMVGAGLGALLVLPFGLPGLILGPFVGAVVGELTVRGDMARAGRAGVAAWIGFLIGTAVKVGIVVLMLGIFAAAMFW
jgi:uncharacterized protein YqgC (DUF456 family)